MPKAFERGWFKMSAPGQCALADAELSRAYGRATQRAWLAYRDAWVRFARMERDATLLRARFKALTSAHGYFHAHAMLKSVSVSVSDPFGDGHIDATFMDVRIRFQLLMIFGDDFEPRGRVVEIDACAPQIELMFLERAFGANRFL